jgi:hypothetical protein
VSIDGVDGAGSGNRGGTYTVYGTLDIDGALISMNNNTFDTKSTSVIVENGGTLKCRYINTGASANSNVLRVKNTGKLTIFGSVDTITATLNDITWNGYSTTNNTWDFQSGSTIEYSGTKQQQVNGITTCSNFIVSGGGLKKLGNDFTVARMLTLSNGKLLVTSTLTLSIGDNSVNGEIVGGSSSSYIVAYRSGSSTGTLKRFVHTAASTIYNLPIGDLDAYTPMTFTLANATLSNAFITIYTNPASIPSINSSLVSYLDRYWDLTPSGITSPTYSVSYTYATADINGVETNFFPVKRSLTGLSSYTWYKPEGANFTIATAQGTGTMDLASNTLTWSGLTTFSLFSAAGDEFVNLPIGIVSFDAKKQGQNNVVFWNTITEENCDYYTLEKTLDGTSYEIVGKMNGGGNSSSLLEYSLVDYDVRKTLNYYRLTETNTDGGEKMSTIIAVDNRENTCKVVVKTLNILGQEIDENYKGIVIVIFEDGTSIKKVQ